MGTGDDTTYDLDFNVFDLIGAEVRTESGIKLQAGLDYTIDRSDASLHFDVIEEPIIITIGIDSPVNPLTKQQQDIVPTYEAWNNVAVYQGDNPTPKDYAHADATYNPVTPVVAKYGQYDEANRLVSWKVVLNPNKVKLDENVFDIMFTDVIPNGMTLVNYTEAATLSGKSINYYNGAEHASSTGKPSLFIQYNGDGPSNCAMTAEAGIEIPVIYVGNVIQQTNVSRIAPSNWDGNQEINVGLSQQSIIISYYTRLDDDEWANITSSADGSKEYTNEATFTDSGDNHYDGETTVKVTTDYFVKKYDDTKEQEGTNTIVDDEGHESDVITYRVEINPFAYTMNSGKTLSLADGIPANMELKLDSVTLMEKSAWTQVDDTTCTEVGALTDVDISYNDDTRMLTINKIPDGHHYTLTFRCVVRATGEDDFVNTVTLTGNGSHSDMVEDKHTVQRVDATIGGEDSELYIHKVDENNITKSLQGAKFRLYRQPLDITLVQADLQKLYQAYIGADNTAGTSDDGKLTPADIQKIADECTLEIFGFNGEGVEMPNALAGNDNGQYVTDDKGMITFQTLKPWEVYYWVETEAPVDPDTNQQYTASGEPHYFIVYKETDADGKYLSDADRKVNQFAAWAFDTLVQRANNVTVASMPSFTTWTATNTLYSSITATKTWEDDANNNYLTRPDAGIILHLHQVWTDDDGTKHDDELTEISPVTIRADEKGNWPKYTWTKLPKTYKLHAGTPQEETAEYLYYVVEEPVPKYNTSYSTDALDADGINSGVIEVVNKLIPTTTSITVTKDDEFKQDTGEKPVQINVKLMVIAEHPDGTKAEPVDSGYTGVLMASNDWTYTWTRLATMNGNDKLTYTVVEDLAALEKAGFKYYAFYSDEGNGVFSSSLEEPLVITNKKEIPGKLTLRKTFTGDITDDSKLTPEQK